MYESMVVWVNTDDSDQAYSELGSVLVNLSMLGGVLVNLSMLGSVLVNLSMLGSVSPSVGRSMTRACECLPSEKA